MADFFEAAIRTFSGFSTETKPTIAAGNNVPNGSRWREVDTGKTYHFDIATDVWYQTSVQIDSITHVPEVIDYAHHEIHSGSHYFMEGYTTLGNDESLYVKMVTPAGTKWSHFVWDITSSFILTTTFTEDATGGMADGSVVTPRNNNRNYPDASGMTITSGVTVNTGGTVISVSSWGAKSAGGGHGRDDEIILKADTVYLRAFTSSTNANIVAFKASWYEHENK